MVKSFKSIKSGNEKNFAQLLQDETGVAVEAMVVVRQLIATKTCYCIETLEVDQADVLMEAEVEHFRPERRGRRIVIFWATGGNEAVPAVLS